MLGKRGERATKKYYWSLNGEGRQVLLGSEECGGLRDWDFFYICVFFSLEMVMYSGWQPRVYTGYVRCVAEPHSRFGGRGGVSHGGPVDENPIL